MKNINLLEILGMLDDEMVQKSIETNDAKKLKELKRLEKKKKSIFFVKFASVLASSFAILCVGIVMINNNRIDNNINDKNSGVQIANPISEVDSIDELEEYIGKSLEKYQIKEIETMTKFNDEEMVQILYKDGTSIRISKDKNTDNSGIYNSNLESKQIINNIEVEIYSIIDIENKSLYAVWQDEGYSYTYYSNNTENTVDILRKIV